MPQSTYSQAEVDAIVLKLKDQIAAIKDDVRSLFTSDSSLDARLDKLELVDGVPAPSPRAPLKIDATVPLALTSLKNNFYMLYYGTPLDLNFDKIVAADPALIVLAGVHPQNVHDAYHAHAIKCLDYIPEHRGTVDVTAAIKTALGNGADGVFFDECESGLSAYNQKVWETVKGFGADKIVIVNPGQASVQTDIFRWADIVSIENQWDATNLKSYGVNPRRFLAVQGDPTSLAPLDLGTAKRRIDTLRTNGGFWYYTGGPEHWKIPSFLADFAQYVKSKGF